MSEDDLRIAILKELEISIQALSPDFIMSPRQKPFSFESERPLIDFILYSHDMECLMPIYLMFGDVNADDIEWMGDVPGKQEQEPQMNADERRLIALLRHKGREAANQYSYFFIEKHPRNRTRMTLIRRIFTDDSIRAHPRHPRNPRSITFAPEGISDHNKYFYEITQQEA